MKKLIAGMKISMDGKFGGVDGYAHWVESWSEDYGLVDRIDTCILGAGMYPGYEAYWTAVQNSDGEALPMTDKRATSEEIAWGKFAANTPHYVLSSTLQSTSWPHTKFLRGLDEIKALKQQTGKDIYLIGGGKTAISLIDAGLVDELHLIIYPLIVGDGVAFLSAIKGSYALELIALRTLCNGSLHLAYNIPRGNN